MEKDGKETLCKPLCLLIYIAENLFLSDSIQQLLQRHRFHFLDQKLVLLTKYASRLKKKKKKRKYLIEKACLHFIFLIGIMKTNHFPYVSHKHILWYITNERFFFFYFFPPFCASGKKRQTPKSSSHTSPVHANVDILESKQSVMS